MKKTSKPSSRRGASRRKPTFNNSRVKTFVRCELQYYYRYDYPVEIMDTRGELVPTHPSHPLKRGSWMHELMAQHWRYSAGTSKYPWEARHKLLSRKFDKLFEEEKALFGDLPTECNDLMRRYLRHYKDEDEQFKVARLPNGKPAVEFIIEVDLTDYGIDGIFKGQIDIVVQDKEYGGYWIRDAKWNKVIPGPDERMMSPQNIMYVWAMREHLGWDLRGFIYDYGRTKPPTEPYILKSGLVTTRKNLDTDVGTYLRAIKRQHGKDAKIAAKTIYRDKLKELKAREVLWFRRERIPVEGPRVANGLEEFLRGCRKIANRDQPVRNYLYNCKWNCAYHEPCVASFQGMDIERLMKSQFVIEPERYTIEEVN